MSEFSGQLDLIAAQQIDERLAHARRHRVRGVRGRRNRRRALARRLPALADLRES